MEVTSISPSRRAERKERLRGEILAAASKMFADRGYEAVTLREIAKEIGYTHAVIYQHFPDKAHILAELSREIGLTPRERSPTAPRESLLDSFWSASLLERLQLVTNRDFEYLVTPSNNERTSLNPRTLTKSISRDRGDEPL